MPWRRSAAAAVPALLALLAACGGGGGGTPSPGNGGNNPPGGGSQSLQIHLSACPSGLSINNAVACMTGLYEGTTTTNGSYCAFNYDVSSGTANYIAGTQALRVGLSAFSAAVFEKKAGTGATDFSISWAIGIGSGKDIDISYQLGSEPASANGLLVKPANTSLPACLVTQGPTVAPTGAASTANLTGRGWQGPQLLNGSSGALGLLGNEPAFDAGLADDGHAFVTFRQPDANGRMAVHVVDGRPGATGQAAAWSAPQVLDADAPLIAGNFRPRIAVSGSGHAVVSWLTERPCEADAVYLANPVGQTCRYFYAARRLASESAWEAPKRVRVSPPMAAQDHYARFNAQGDLFIAFPSYDPLFGVSTLTSSTLAFRRVADSGYQAFRLGGFWSNPVDTVAFANRVLATLDDAGNLFVAGQSGGPFDLAQLKTTVDAALANPIGTNLPTTTASGVDAIELRTGSTGFAAYTWRDSSGSRQSPNQLSIYSPVAQAWLAPSDITAYTLWGDSALVGTDAAGGEFLLYAGCKLTAWRAGTWSSTRALPGYCGRDRPGGVYAFNRLGDYVGINWAGQPGQWGYYRRAQDALLKGAPGSGSTVAGDFVLGTASGAFATPTTQLLLAPNGLALAVASNTFATLPSEANPAGTAGGTATRLWAVYLK